MDTEATAGHCPICGGPLRAEGGGWFCSHCRAQVRIEVVAGPVGDVFAGHGRFAEFSLVPGDVGDFLLGTNVPFIDLILVTLGYGPTYGLSAEPAVRAFVQGTPGLYDRIRALGAAVGAAGLRARDGGLLSGGSDDRLKHYSAPEIWAFDLALDVISLLADLPDVSRRERFSAQTTLRDLDWKARSRAWKKAVRHAGDGVPAELLKLRASVPRRGRLRAGSTRGDDVTWP